MKRLIWLLLLSVAVAQTTPRLNLNVPAHNTANWDTLLNSNFTTLDNAAVLGASNAFIGANTFSGKNTFANINLRQMCDQFAGGTFDVKVNACIAAVIAQGGGIADATGLTGAQTGTTEIDIGTTTVSGVTNNNISVTLQLSPFLVYTFTSTTAGACGFKVFSESRLIGTLAGTTHSAQIVAGTGTNTGALICSNTAAGQYINIQGVMAYNNVGATLTNGAVYIFNTVDTSSISDMVIANYGGIGLHIRSTCCQTVFRNIISDGNSVAGSKPVVIESLSGDNSSVSAIQITGLSADHPGTGLNAVSVKHSFASSLSPCSIGFNNLYSESNNTDVASDLVSIDSCQSVTINGFGAMYRPNSGGPITGVAVRLSSVSSPSFSPNLTLLNGLYINSGQITCPYTFVAENYGSFALPTTANCTFPFYSAGDGTASADQLQAVRQFTLVENGSGLIAAVNRDVCTGSQSLHQPTCNYNNGASAGQLPLTANAGGTHSDSGFFQTKRAVAGCTTGGAAGNSCGTDITVTWGTAFADANYSVTCTGNNPTNAPSGPFIVNGTKLAATVHINYFAITAAAASYASIDCIGVHD